LLRLNFTIKYVLKIKIEKINGLSKRPDWKVETKNDNENQKLIKEK